MTPEPSGLAGLIGARVTILGSIKLASHVNLAVSAVRGGRSRWWLAAGVAALAADLTMIRRLRDPAYRPGAGFAAAELVDTALWSSVSDDRPNGADLILAADTFGSALLAAWRVTAGRKAVPVYDDRFDFPPRGLREWLRAGLTLARPVVLPAAVAAAVRRARGQRTHAANAVWGVVGGMVGVLTARQRHSLHARTRRLWEERARSIVDREADSARVRMATSSSPGHDFKKTLFALGMAGSGAAMERAMLQGEHPARQIERFRGRLLAEASHHLRVEPPVEAVRLLTVDQVRAVEAFLVEAERHAKHGADQSLHVEHVPPFGFRLRHLGSEVVLTNDPPPLVAEHNPTAITFAVSTVMKAIDVMAPVGRWMPRSIGVPLLIPDLYGTLRYWRRPPGAGDLGRVALLSTIPAAVGMLLAGTRLVGTTDAEGHAVYPAIYYLRNVLFVLLPNWKHLSAGQRRAVWGLGALAVVTSAARRRDGVDWPRLLVELSAAAVAFSVAGIADRAEEEAKMLEEVEFAWFARQVEEARAAGEALEVERYRVHLEVARSALGELDDLEGGLREALEAECAELSEWIAARDRQVPVRA